jgi:hypothetical protein
MDDVFLLAVDTVPKGKRPVRRTKRRREERVKIDPKEIGWKFMALIRLFQNCA